MLKYIRTYKNLIPEDLCKEFINYMDTNNSIISKINTGEEANDYRNSESIFIPVGNCLISKILYDKLTDIMYNKCLKQYIKDIDSIFFICDTFTLSHEYPAILKYKPNQGFYKIHVDNFSFESSMRVFSAVIYLNNVDDGGETYFPELKIKCKPEMGKVLIFPSGLSYPHLAFTPKSNTKYCIVWWFTYKGNDINTIFNRDIMD